MTQQQTKAKIFLADQRGAQQTKQFQSKYTFNYGSYYNEHKNGFGNIYLLNDDMLAGAGELNMEVKQASYILLIPIAGAIRYKDNLNNNHFIAAGQVHCMEAPEGLLMNISNPFRDDYVNFLQVWIKVDKPNRASGRSDLFTYEDVNERLNNLVYVLPDKKIAAAYPFSVSLGKFAGRGEGVYQTKNGNVGLFVFVAEGAFEVEGRLLHARDGLALWDPKTIEMEALSNGAIVFIFELSNADTIV
ncbi:MAG: pirin family protein [Chitinophagaceae bacterium]